MEGTNLIDDDIYKALKGAFLSVGRGRPRHPPEVPLITKKLLAQLHCLTKDGGKPPTIINDWLHLLTPAASNLCVRDTHLPNLAKSAFTHYQDLSLKNSQDSTCCNVEEFLNTPVDLLTISSHLNELAINRATFCSAPLEPLNPPKLIKNRVVVDLELYRLYHGLQKKFVIDWLFAFSGLDKIKLGKLLTSCYEKYKNLSKSKSKFPFALETFLEECFPPSAKPLPVSDKPSSQLISNKICLKCDKNSSDVKQLKIKVKELESQIAEEKRHSQNLEVVLEQLKDKEKSMLLYISNLEQEKSELNKEFKKVTASLQNCAKQKSSLEILRLKDASKKKNLRLKVKANSAVFRRTLKAKDLSLKDSDEQHKNLKKELAVLRQSLKTIKAEKRLKTDKSESSSIKPEIDALKSDTNNTYSDNVRKTVIALQSDAGVAAGNVGNVIRIVSEGIFDHTISENLPCKQTAINMNNEGGVVSNIQVAENLLQSKNATIHIDGTSRDHKKVVGHQISLDNGETLFLGFTPVCSEDSSTLLEVTINLLKKISECYSKLHEQEMNEVFKKCLTKITSTMTDRAAVMKSFDQRFKEFLESEIGGEVQMHFLFCNAHFLLGLSSACEKALEVSESEIIELSGEPLGRDKDKLFSSFQADKETATNRVIRTACDILGPRGDQKNGCREEWKAFCDDTLIPCFKSNRFNCFFEAAAAIIHHLCKIQLFFSSGVLPENVNKKIKSVSHDVSDERLLACLCAVSLFFIHVTDPYWRLINSSVKYFDLHVHIKKLHECFHLWTSDPSQLLDPSTSVFGLDHNVDSVFKSSVFAFVKKTNVSILNLILKNMSFYCVEVLERQLSDFLSINESTGIFSKPLDDTSCEALRHCPLTNLVGESAFGDLDYQIKKRPNCSFLNRTASHIIKRNKTIKYISSKSKSHVSRMFTLARKQSRILKVQSMAYETEVSNQMRQKMRDQQQKKIDRTLADIKRQSELIERIQKYGGPFKKVADVEKFREQFRKEGKSKKEVLEAFKDEIRFQKLVGGGRHLTLKGTLQDLTERLKDTLRHAEENADFSDTDTETSKSADILPSSKRPRFH